MTQMMKQWQLSGFGQENLHCVEVPRPQPGQGEVLVKTSAVALNYRDKLVIENGMGMPLTLPIVPGSDMAGTVVETGAGATRFKADDRIISTFFPDWTDSELDGNAKTNANDALGGVYPGVLSEYTAMPESWFVHAPQTLDMAQASTLVCAGLTAWSALVGFKPIHAGQTVLVQGTGGVALFAAQIAKMHGAKVAITSSSDEKLERARALGLVDHAINRIKTDWVEELLKKTDDQGADHIVELVGGAHLGRSLEAARAGGQIAVIGVFGGFEISGSVGPLLNKAVTIQGIRVGHQRALRDLVSAVDQSGVTPIIDKHYDFSNLPQALEHLSKGAFGKIVIDL